MIWVPFHEHKKAEDGEERIETEGEQIICSQMCCLHKGEWILFERHLRGGRALQKNL